jgi:AcrR family transcriptional regulator
LTRSLTIVKLQTVTASATDKPLTSAGRSSRDDILVAAIDMFAELGYAGTSMRALGRAVGMKESALYHYFDSKDALFNAMIESVVMRRASLVEAELRTASKKPLRALLTQLTRFIYEHMETPLERKFWRIMMAEGRRIVGAIELLGQLILRQRQAFLQIFEELRASGGMRSDVRVEIFILHFIAPIILMTNAPMGGGKGPIHMKKDDFIKAHVDFLLEAVAPRANKADRKRK